MILFPPAKINLGLNVLYKRDDSFHELDTCMLTIPITDALEILRADEFSFRQTGLLIPGSIEENICVKAFRLMKENFKIPAVYIHLRKEIPMGAGLGGGSADAAYVLKGIDQLFNLNCSIELLESFAAELGSDCPFFIKNKAQIAKGRGEILYPCAIDLKGYYIKIVNPGIHIGTKEAYSGIIFNDEKKSVQTIVEGPIENWKSELKNDFESSCFAQYPVLLEIKNKLYFEGAVYASMSGSGSTMFGIYRNEPKKSFLGHPSYLEINKRF